MARLVHTTMSKGSCAMATTDQFIQAICRYAHVETDTYVDAYAVGMALGMDVPAVQSIVDTLRNRGMIAVERERDRLTISLTDRGIADVMARLAA
jgi:predicted transcriptional regulator